LLHTCPAEQADPHAPQLFLSLVRLAQVPPQFCWSRGQEQTIPHSQPVTVLTSTCPLAQLIARLDVVMLLSATEAAVMA
jgi:hypothetical protein